MSYEIGCCGIWGVEITEENVGKELHDKLCQAIADYDTDKHDAVSDALEPLNNSVRLVLAKGGVVVPDNCYLDYTGSGDDYPGRCATPAETILFGLGMYMPPWQCPTVDESFKKVADLHTWCWGG